ncbi:MAG: GNAT family N-acetyltransferase [Candidatus Micrarchaeota archaeon]|nr:GNAT family N-acetyltransferase [Candidatus Micrarchaeota archaeon]
MASKLLIRRYRDSDFEEMFRLHHTALALVGADLGEGPWDDDLRRIKKEYFDNRGEFLIATIGKRLVGMGALRSKGRKTAEIKRMRVRPGLQREGIGTKLLEKLEAHARECGYSRLILDATAKQAGALGFYGKNGYAEIRRKRAGKFVLIIMEKKLD